MLPPLGLLPAGATRGLFLASAGGAGGGAGGVGGAVLLEVLQVEVAEVEGAVLRRLERPAGLAALSPGEGGLRIYSCNN